MKLLDYSGLQRFLSKIKTLLDSKSNTGHTHVTSEVTDLLNSQHTWSAQQSYSADLNLNYASTDVDDILDTVAGSYTAEDFLAQNNVWTGSNKYSQNLNITNSGWEQGVTPASLASRYIQFLDKNNNSSGAVGFHQDNTGSSFLNILAGDKYDNGAKSTSGTLIRNQFRIGTTETGLKYQKIEGSWNCNLTPLANNTYDLGSFSNQWSNVYANEVKTTLVDPYTNTALIVRSTDNTWDNGARMFLYSNSYLSQGYGLFYLDVDHGDNNHTKTTVTLAPNSFHPQGGTVNTTYGVSLGTATAQWAKVYAEKYYYNGTQWGLDKANEWTGSNSYTGVVLLNSSSDVAEQFKQKLPKDVSVSTDALVRFNTLTDSEDHNIIVEALGHWASYVSKSTTLQYKNDSTKRGTIDFRLTSDGYGVFYPETPFECNLGNAGNQWKSIYAQTYFYNGTQWGLDQTNEWTGNNKFKSSSTNFGLQSTTAEIGSLTASSNWMYWLDKNGYQDAYISRDFWNDGSDSLRISISGKRANGAPSTSGTAVECGVRLDIAANGTKSVNPFVSNDTNLGSSALWWKDCFSKQVRTTLVDPYLDTALLLRSTDNTWENGARIFLYSNTHPGQTYGTIYTDVDHGDGNNTKTGLILAPYGLYPMGGGTSGVSLGSSTNRWSSVYAEQYYYNGTAWGLDKGNLWTEGNTFTKSIILNNTDITDYKSNPSSDKEKWLQFWSNEWKYWGGVGHVYLTTGVSEIRIAMSNWRTNGSQGYWHLDFGTDKNFSQVYFRPSENNGCHLGDASHKWSNCHATTFYENGTALSSKYQALSEATSVEVGLGQTFLVGIRADRVKAANVSTGTRLEYQVSTIKASALTVLEFTVGSGTSNLYLMASETSSVPSSGGTYVWLGKTYNSITVSTSQYYVGIVKRISIS